MNETIRKLMYPKDKKEYHEAFLEHYTQGKPKEKMIEMEGEEYFNEVIRIHRLRLEKNYFNIGPQSKEDWIKFKEELNKKESL